MNKKKDLKLDTSYHQHNKRTRTRDDVFSAEDEWNADQLELHARVETLDGNEDFAGTLAQLSVKPAFGRRRLGRPDEGNICHDGKRYF